MKKKTPVFIVFEGLDGSGKTTCAKRTAELLGARYLTTPCGVVRQYRDDIIREYGACQEAAQLFYLSTVYDASEKVKDCLLNGESIVLDRYFLSTQVYAEFRGTRFELDSALGKLLQPADYTVFLEAPLEIRRERIMYRGSTADDDETLTADADFELGKAYMRRRELPVTGRWLSMDTSDMSVEEIAKSIVHTLRAISAID